MSDPILLPVFAQFVGREVPAIERHSGESSSIMIDYNSSIIAQMRETAYGVNRWLRVVKSDEIVSSGKCEQPHVVARIEETDDGKYRVTDGFSFVM